MLVSQYKEGSYHDDRAQICAYNFSLLDVVKGGGGTQDGQKSFVGFYVPLVMFTVAVL